MYGTNIAGSSGRKISTKKQALRRFTGKAHRRANVKRLNFGIARTKKLQSSKDPDSFVRR